MPKTALQFSHNGREVAVFVAGGLVSRFAGSRAAAEAAGGADAEVAVPDQG